MREMNPRNRIVATLIVSSLCLAVPFLHSASAETSIRSSLSFGYDSFIDRYTILEDDTTDTAQEIYGSLDNSLDWRRGSLRTGLYNSLRFGDQAINDNLLASFAAGSRRATRFEIRSNLFVKRFQSGSDYQFGNDYTQTNSTARISRQFSESLRAGIKGRFELVDYRDRTDFDYDYRYFDAGIEVEGGSYFSKFLRIAAAAGHRDVPDTTSLNYNRLIADLELRLPPSSNMMFEMSMTGDRRDYRESVKSSAWNLYTETSLTVSRPSGNRFSLRIETESYLYDSPSKTFFNTWFARSGLRSTIPIRESLSVFAEPRYARMFCSDFSEERYWEGSIVLGCDLLGGEKYWLNFTYEPGRRNYLVEENEIYSDFYLNRLSLMGSVSAGNGVSITLFVMHDPEKHARRDDDFSITLISASVGKSF